jgi:ribosomal-protein-alanine N-acetyltransferase
VIGLLKRSTSYGLPGRWFRATDLKTGQLRLVAIAEDMLWAEQEGNVAALGRRLQSDVTAEWPPVDWQPHVYGFILQQYEERPESFGWHRYVLLEDIAGRRKTLIGAVGGFPKPNGDVEIGYSTLPEFQRRGYATAFAKKLTEWLLTREDVRSVSAQTFSWMTESIKVMERCGMEYVGDGDDPGTVRYRRVKQGIGE